MKRIDFLDKAAERKAPYTEIGVNHNFGLAYFAALRNGNDRIDFSGALHESDTEAIIADCRRFGVTEVTVSSTWSGVVDRVAAFIKITVLAWQMLNILIQCNYFQIKRP